MAAEESVRSTVKVVEEQRLVTEIDVTKISVDAEFFKDVFDLAASLIKTEVQFEIKDDGLHLKQLDEARIGRTDLFIPKALFRELKKGKELCQLRFDVKDIKSILSGVGKGDIVTFSIGRLTENDSVGLLVEVSGKRVNRYSLPLFAPEELEQRDPKVVFATKVRTNIDGIVSTVDKAKVLLTQGGGGNKKKWFGTFTLTSNPVGISLKFSNDEGSKKGELQLNAMWDIMQFEGRTDQQVVISQAYLEAVIKSIAKITNMITIEMSTFIPLHITAELPFKGSLAFWIAPRVPDTEAERIRGRAPEKEVSAS